MAEAVADASEDADCAPSSVKKGSCPGVQVLLYYERLTL